MDRCAMINPLNHPVYQELPQRTQRKMLSPISEDKLTWDCFFGLKQAESLGPALSAALNLPPDTFKEAELILWGFQIGESSYAPWGPLARVLAELECYNDGKPEGQKTEPDAIILSSTSITVIECKRTSSLGHCSRFGKRECPEVNLEQRKRLYCQYWARGLSELTTFPKPLPGAGAAHCDRFYQLMRNEMVGLRLAHLLGLRLHLVTVKGKNSAGFAQMEEDVRSFNGSISLGPKFSILCWNDLRFAKGKDLLAAYVSELPRIA
jgi:hypothetical protein